MEDKKKTLPEKVHDLYFKVFPGADCPVTGAAREKLITASRSCSQGQQSEQEPSASCSSAASSPQPESKYKHPHVYDVYGRRIDQQNLQGEKAEVWRMPSFLYTSSFYNPQQDARPGGSFEEINPANRMPVHANQVPAPGQKEPLSTLRQKSTIPKGGTEDTWVYPSPQMFFNSLVRKNKADDVTENDMDAVVATHNSVNEATWSRLLRWEQLYAEMYPESGREDPRLLHFRGRPTDLTPKAYLKKFLGFGVPFDRHDWIVDRGGREMRYVIDFYYDESKDWPFFVDRLIRLKRWILMVVQAELKLEGVLPASGVRSFAQEI
ncbi:hypothetical protein GOP47_0013797 [Adiantum capillus-veneris]|uniref:Holocytochrome c-type synthase n=1 Tax=Adiantum capillus-veneris TaxID=13818 RepID=A0A9D4ZG45_ADICA|nr:hypothetical protein GOP47_0013797 [Adiantum capillus-veneris]